MMALLRNLRQLFGHSVNGHDRFYADAPLALTVWRWT
jgi:hypothetical protein